MTIWVVLRRRGIFEELSAYSDLRHRQIEQLPMRNLLGRKIEHYLPSSIFSVERTKNPPSSLISPNPASPVSLGFRSSDLTFNLEDRSEDLGRLSAGSFTMVRTSKHNKHILYQYVCVVRQFWTFADKRQHILLLVLQIAYFLDVCPFTRRPNFSHMIL